MQLSPRVFGAPLRPDILQRVVTYQRAQWWQGTAKTKTRAEVRGGGRKPFPQKGNGRARAGSIRSPNWRHGGVSHGPVPRSHAIQLPRQVRELGLRVALSTKLAQGELLIADELSVPEAKTKVLHGMLEEQGLRSVLLVVAGDGVPESLARAAANLPKCKVIATKDINVYDLLHQRVAVLSREAVQALERSLARRPRRGQRHLPQPPLVLPPVYVPALVAPAAAPEAPEGQALHPGQQEAADAVPLAPARAI